MAIQTLIIKNYFQILSAVAPKTAAKKGFEVFQKIRKKNIREREQHFFDNATAFTVNAELDKDKHEILNCYKMGDEKNPLVILVHGWDSNAGSLSQIANKLVDENKSVILFNLPGHAFYKANSTNIFECKNAFLAILKHINPPPNFSIVSHSFGSAVVAYTLSKSNYSVNKLIFLTSPNKLTNVFTDFKKFIGLNDKAYKYLLKLTHNKLGEPLEEVTTAKSLAKFKFNNLLLIHDKKDKVISYYNSEELIDAAANSKLISYENIGHYRMLWNNDVIVNCLEFLNS